MEEKTAENCGKSRCECYAVTRSAAMISRANGKHCPQRGLQPTARYALVGQEAPQRAALRTSDSRIALQTQTIMEIAISDNAKRSQQLNR
jgi:hypothetical protein